MTTILVWASNVINEQYLQVKHLSRSQTKQHITMIEYWEDKYKHAHHFMSVALGPTVESHYSVVRYNLAIVCDTTMVVAEHKSELKLTKDTPYLALKSELWGVYCEDLGKDWPRYNDTPLYFTNDFSLTIPALRKINFAAISFPAKSDH